MQWQLDFISQSGGEGILGTLICIVQGAHEVKGYCLVYYAIMAYLSTFKNKLDVF